MLTLTTGFFAVDLGYCDKSFSQWSPTPVCRCHRQFQERVPWTQACCLGATKRHNHRTVPCCPCLLQSLVRWWLLLRLQTHAILPALTIFVATQRPIIPGGRPITSIMATNASMVPAFQLHGLCLLMLP